MKKFIKFLVFFIGIILITFIIDLVCTFNFNRPLFAYKDKDGVYRGIFFDVYNCSEYSIVQIKSKGDKFSCRVSN